MVDRLGPVDMRILHADSLQTPMHNATLEVFRPGDRKLTYESFMEHIADRIAFVPRYRQRLHRFAGRLATPVWVDDEDFDLRHHVHRAAVPRPGSLVELRDTCARTMARQLEMDRPLWEMFFIEGLSDGRVAVLSKTHHLLVDGIHSIDLGQALFDVDSGPHDQIPDNWAPRPRPSTQRLLAGAVGDSLIKPRIAIGNVVNAASGLVSAATDVRTSAERVVGAVLDRASMQDSPFNAPPSTQRRVHFVDTALDDYNKVRKALGGTTNDVVLAVLTGAVRAWYMTREEDVSTGRRLRALVPMSVQADEQASQIGTTLVGQMVDLPIGEGSPVVRLHQVSYALRGHIEKGHSVPAANMAGLPGFAPATFHALAARVAVEHAQFKDVNLVINYVPGPRFPMYLAGAEMVETYPVPALHPGFTMSIGVTSYNGRVSYGFTADRESISDLALIGQCVTDALEELLESIDGLKKRAPRGRKKPKS